MQTSVFVAASACAVVIALAGVTVTAQPAPAEPTVRVENESLAPNETTTVGIRLSAAPDGLSGYSLTVTPSNDTVTVTNASVAAEFGLANDTVDGDTATLEGVDTTGAVGPGSTDVVLGTVTVRGEIAGTANLLVRSSRIDDENGSAVAHATASGTVTVGVGDGDNETGATDDGNETAAADGSGHGFGVTAAVLASVLAVLVAARVRSPSGNRVDTLL